MKPGIQLRLHQQLALTPQLQQAIRLLQLSQVELETELRELAETNPLLELDAPEESGDGVEGEAETAPAEVEPESSAEYDEPWEERELGGEAPLPAFSDDDDAPEHQDAAQEGLREHLMWQLNLARFSDRDQVIAAAIIDALDADGYLHEGLEPVLAAVGGLAPAPDVEEIEAVRHRVQRFEPTGVASLDLRDCLDVQLLQLPEQTCGRELALRIVASELELLAKRDFPRLARKLDASPEDV